MVASLVCRFLRYADNAHIFLRRLEEVVLRLLAGYGVAGRRIDGKSGVFVGGDKIAAIGLAVSHSVTMHGMSINIAPEMRHYEAIIACGLAENGITSLERLGVRVDYNSVRDAWLASFEEVFGVRPYAAARGIINKGSANN
jgi:lipoate-protein ligase B